VITGTNTKLVSDIVFRRQMRPKWTFF